MTLSPEIPKWQIEGTLSVKGDTEHAEVGSFVLPDVPAQAGGWCWRGACGWLPTDDLPAFPTTSIHK